jgi:predicted transposase/invertase (TIGR01784 family)
MSNINPRIDVAFKKIFGVEENKDLLISLINSIVKEKDKVEDVTLLNHYNPQNFQNDKLSILDIKAKGLNGRLFNIEIQITNHADYDKRALYYWARLYTEQLDAGGDYRELSKTIGIHILNFHSIPNAENYHNSFCITEEETGIKYFEDFEMHTIELSKFSKDIEDDKAKLLSKIKTALDCWSAFLTKHDLLDPENLTEELKQIPVKKAISVLDVMNLGDLERSLYEDHLKFIRDEDSAIRTAEAKGREEGIEEGVKNTKHKAAINLLQKGVNPDIVSSALDLHKSIIDKIKESL